MSRRDSFSSRPSSLIEQRFVLNTLEDHGQTMRLAHIAAIKAATRKKSGKLRKGPTVEVKPAGKAGGRLIMTHLKRQRFLDIQGKKIHNRIVFGHLSDLIRQLKYGFTEDIRRAMEQDTNRTIEL